MTQFASATPNPSDPQWSSYVKEPLRMVDPDAAQWDQSADVVVVGFGGAGVCAALEAKSQGVDVLALDRFEGGGATYLSGGIYYGGGTSYQREAGYEDSAEEMYRYLRLELSDAIPDAVLRKFCEESNPNLEWLVSHGVPFASRVYEGKRTYPPYGYDLYYSGNEKTADFSAHAKPAPRGHRVVGVKYTGNVLYEKLRQSAEARGVRLLRHCPVTRLIVDANDVVIGVEANVIPEGSPAWKEHRKLIRRVNAWQRLIEPAVMRTAERVAQIEREAGRPFRVRARRSVVLSTGSFAFNRGMVRQYARKYAEAMPLGTLGCDGSGIRLGQSVGGATDCMNSVTAWRSISPPITFVQGLVVNREGKRFLNEDAYLGRLGEFVADQPGGRAWVIIDREAYLKSFRDAVPSKSESFIELSLPLLMTLLTNKTKGRTVRELAERLSISAEVLEATVAKYNAAMQSGQDELGKLKDYQRALGAGPYYAIDISIGSKKFPCPSITMGGLLVDDISGQVQRADGSFIVGLYAAGRAAKGIPAGFYVSGTSIADCVFSGRRAGRSAARTEARQVGPVFGKAANAQ